DTLWVYDKTPELGMNTFQLGATDLAALSALHSRVVRVSLWVDLYMLNGGENDFTATINTLCNNGFVPLVVVTSGEDYIGSPVGDYNLFASFMGARAAQYPCVRYWQLWNEVETNFLGARVF